MGICRKARVKVPVIIGTLPLQTTYSNFVPQSIPAQFGGTTVTINNPSPRSRSVYPHRPSTPSYQPSTPSHSPSASSHSPTAPPQQPYSSDPPPYSASFLPDEYRDVRKCCVLVVVLTVPYCGVPYGVLPHVQCPFFHFNVQFSLCSSVPSSTTMSSLLCVVVSLLPPQCVPPPQCLVFLVLIVSSQTLFHLGFTVSLLFLPPLYYILHTFPHIISST